jgi:hypothetical protein
MEGVTPEVAHWIPPGRANPVGATYAHVVFSEDRAINVMLRHGQPLYATTWAGRTGVSDVMPERDENWDDYAPWTRRVTVDVPVVRAYAQAVYATSEAYLAALAPDATEASLNLSGIGLGEVTQGWVLSRLVIGHTDNITGEISCLKGLHDLRGYPL